MPPDPPSQNRNSRNGLFLKVIMGVLVTGLASAGAGLIKLYGDVSVLKAGTALERRVETIEVLANSINKDRHERTIKLEQIKTDIDELKAAVKRLEGRR